MLKKSVIKKIIFVFFEKLGCYILFISEFNFVFIFIFSLVIFVFYFLDLK